MKIQLCGFFHLKKISVADGEVVTIPCVFDEDLLNEYLQTAWTILEDAGLAEKSVVDIVATITEDYNEKKQPYAVVIYRKGIESYTKAKSIAEGLKWSGINVEKYAQIEFYSSDKF